MNEADFITGMPGRLVKIPEGVWAFVPNPLSPTNLDMTWGLANQNSEADRALSELAGVARTLPNAHLLTGPFVRREAVLSSRIEGTQATMSQLFLFEAGASPAENRTDVREVYNYVKALDYGLELLKDLPVCKRLILAIHGVLLEGVRGEDKTPGEFRRKQNYIGAIGCKIEDATYVPPPVNEMQKALDDLEKFINMDSTLPPLIRQALVHYQFEAIHPFVDGNGRVGRLLLTLLLCAEGITPLPLLYLSDYIERHKDNYYQLLLSTSQKGTWNEWVMFFLRGVAEQSRDAVRRAHSLLDLRREYRRRLEAKRVSALPLRLLNELFHIPMISSSQVTKLLEVDVKTSLRVIDKLLVAGIIEEVNTGRRRNKIYIANEIRRIVEE